MVPSIPVVYNLSPLVSIAKHLPSWAFSTDFKNVNSLVLRSKLKAKTVPSVFATNNRSFIGFTAAHKISPLGILSTFLNSGWFKAEKLLKSHCRILPQAKLLRIKQMKV